MNKENSIYLPKLTKVKIANYSLYSADIEFDFINGLNLIVGGNGVGKTTFVNIVKYALIGLYKKDLIVRNYQNEKRLFRGTYSNCNTYFRNRTKEEEQDKEGYVLLLFDINNTSFEVKRSLYNSELLEAYYYDENMIKNKILGEVVRQDFYSKYENSDETEKKRFLQYNYEKLVAQRSNLSDFNDVIFFVNQILLFGENREDVLWSEDAQNRLLSNYFNDATLEKRRKELTYDAKYHDSVSRHKQEEIKAINKVLQQIEEKNDRNYKENDIVKVASKIESLKNRLNNLDNSRKNLQKKMSEIYKKISIISSNIIEKEKIKECIEKDVSNKIYWIGVNPKYSMFKKQFTVNHVCPMCNSQLNDKSRLNDDNKKCFLCNSDIVKDVEEDSKLNEIQSVLKSMMEERKKHESIILDNEKELKKFDEEYRKTKSELFDKENRLRELESLRESSDTKGESSYLAMLNRINQLRIEKDNAAKKSDNCNSEKNEIIKKIEEDLLNSTKTISGIFSEFAQAFLHLNCELTFKDGLNGKNKMFIPIIDGKTRYDAEELSESQRFFVDYSFRMSILSYFYQGQTFYICETPDSSLDISYEENAANTFMKFLEKPNSLIITSNLNNSTFVDYILSKVENVNILNLLKYGKTSSVQRNHFELQKLSDKLEEYVNGK